MDEPCSALDPISTLAIEDLICEIKQNYTIVIVTHNMQQAARVSDRTAFFNLAATGKPGHLIEMDDTTKIFSNPGEGDRGLHLRPFRLSAPRHGVGTGAVRGRPDLRVDELDVTAGRRLRTADVEELGVDGLGVDGLGVAPGVGGRALLAGGEGGLGARPRRRCARWSPTRARSRRR